MDTVQKPEFHSQIFKLIVMDALRLTAAKEPSDPCMTDFVNRVRSLLWLQVKHKYFVFIVHNPLSNRQ